VEERQFVDSFRPGRNPGLWIRIDLMRIRIDNFFIADSCPYPDPFYFCFIEIAIYLSEASIMDAQARLAGEAISPQKRTSSTLKHENFLLFSIFKLVIFAFLDPGPQLWYFQSLIRPTFYLSG
jgi:hypothetical protein